MRIPFTSEGLNQISLIGSENYILKCFDSTQGLNPQAGACKESTFSLSCTSYKMNKTPTSACNTYKEIFFKRQTFS